MLRFKRRENGVGLATQSLNSLRGSWGTVGVVILSVSYTDYQNSITVHLTTKRVGDKRQGKRWSAPDQRKLEDLSRE